MPHLRGTGEQVQASGVGEENFGSMGLGVEDKLRNLVEQMKVAGYNSHMIKLVKELVGELQQRAIYGVDRFVKKLSDRSNEKQDYLDILREGRFAIILARNRLSEITFIKEKEEQRFPDIKADWNRSTIYFEVTRSRPSDEDKAVQSGVSFVSQKSIENIIGKIQEKIPQLQSGEINIVVIWSDTINWLPCIMEEAFKYIISCGVIASPFNKTSPLSPSDLKGENS